MLCVGLNLIMGRLALVAVGLFLASTAFAGEVVLPVKDLVEGQGYPFSEHKITTEDGYILAIHRIPYGKNSSAPKRGPLILQHGIVCSSASWVISTPEKGLGFILADAGYDVWMTNSRGNMYSRHHVSLDPDKDKAQFWNFSFHEMGYYDLPAVIDYILEQTNETQLSYVGHSQGTTQFFVLASSRPEYNHKIKVMEALAPVAYLEHVRGAVHVIASITKLADYITEKLGLYELLDDSYFLNLFDTTVCREKAVTQVLCDNLLFLVAGYDSDQLNTSLVPTISNYFPAGSSVKQLVHFGQLANSGTFRMYDYGIIGNMKTYKSLKPPSYPLDKITVPIKLHYSLNDWLAGPQDVMTLFTKLDPKITSLEQVPFASFNHLDFMWAKDADTLVYNNVVDELNSAQT